LWLGALGLALAILRPLPVPGRTLHAVAGTTDLGSRLVALFESTEAFIQLHEASLDSLKEFGRHLRGRMISLLARPVVGVEWWQLLSALRHLAAHQCHGALKFLAMTGEVMPRAGVIVFVLVLVVRPGVLVSGFSMGLVVVVMLGAIVFVLGLIVLVLGVHLPGLSVIMRPLSRPKLGEFSVGAFELLELDLGVIVLARELLSPMGFHAFGVDALDGLKFNALTLGGLGAVVSLRPSWQHQAAQKKEGGGLFFHRFVA
jgi:hypothetical protein